MGNDPARAILLIAYHFPPSAAVGGIRIANLAQGLSSLGWDAHVLTVRERDIEQVDGGRLRDTEGISVHRAAVLPTIERVYRAIRSPRAVETPRATDPGCAAAHETLVQAIRRYILSFLALPDRERGWLLPASLAALRMVRRRRFQWILTSCPPYSGHLVGLVVKYLTGARWAADFRDPWMTTGSKRLFPTSAASVKIESWLEKKVIEGADLALFSVDRLRAAYRERYRHVAAEKFVHVPNGIRRGPPAGDRSVGKYEQFTLAYTGSLYLGRSPEPVCQAVARLMREGSIAPGTCRIKLVGHCGTVDGMATASVVERYGLQSVVEIHDPVSHQEAQDIIRRSHLALLLAPDQTYQVPAKAYDYLAAGARILAIAGDGATKDLVQETGSGEAFAPDDIAGIAGFIRREMATRHSPNGGSTAAAARFDIRRVTADLVACMEGVERTDRAAGVRGR